MKRIYFIIFLLNIYRSTTGTEQDQKILDDIKNKLYINFQNDVEQQDKRGVGDLTVVEKDNKKYLRVEFSDIMRIPEIHFSKLIEIEQVDENFIQETAHRVVSDFIKFEENFQNKFEIMDIYSISDLIEEFFKSKAIQLNNSKGLNVDLSCEMDDNDNRDFIHQKCVDKNNDKAKFIDYEIKIVDTKYYMINLRTIYGDFEFLIPVFLGKERINEKLENLYKEIKEKKLEQILSLNQIEEIIKEKTKKYNNCFVFVEKTTPTLLKLTILDKDSYDFYESIAAENRNNSGINEEEERKLKKLKKLKIKERKLEGGDCILFDTEIFLIDYDMPNFQNYQLRLSYPEELYISEHLLVKQNSDDFKKELNFTLDEYFKELDTLIEIKKKEKPVVKEGEEEDVPKNILKIEDFEEKIKEKFSNLEESKINNKILYTENGIEVIEVFDKTEDNETFEVLFTYPVNNILGSKAHSGIVINKDKDLEHFQFFENELQKLSNAIASKKILV